jgi:hypothetical protein
MEIRREYYRRNGRIFIFLFICVFSENIFLCFDFYTLGAIST